MKSTSCTVRQSSKPVTQCKFHQVSGSMLTRGQVLVQHEIEESLDASEYTLSSVSLKAA